MKSPRSFLLISSLALLVSCGPSAQTGGALPGADTTCAANSAQIAVEDGIQEILCGCQEAAGTPVAAGSGINVTCTVPVGTQMFFVYTGTMLKHQIIPVDGVSFAASPVNDPSSSPVFLVESFPLTVAGSIAYVDAYNAGITGTLIAQ